ncbi:hypothetical protein CRG98_022609 [Punica granatum]|uniref:Uncharacterized protein n=1 Tax=Punica granatum TaxID=22663 RepID=A0A2I0JM44_PUNGR|nr:hypothetical protein CRG98_022609 [Punica granatum]
MAGTTHFEVREPLVVRKGHGTHGHASQRDGRESRCPSRTHGSSFAPKFVAPYILLSLTVIITCIRDGKARDLDVRDPKRSNVSRETHGHPLCKGGRELSVVVCIMSVLSVFFCFILAYDDLLRFGPEPIGYALHGVQRPKSPNTRSNASSLTERVQPVCGMGSSLDSPLHSEYGLCGRQFGLGV